MVDEKQYLKYHIPDASGGVKVSLGRELFNENHDPENGQFAEGGGGGSGGSGSSGNRSGRGTIENRVSPKGNIIAAKITYAENDLTLKTTTGENVPIKSIGGNRDGISHSVVIGPTKTDIFDVGGEITKLEGTDLTFSRDSHDYTIHLSPESHSTIKGEIQRLPPTFIKPQHASNPALHAFNRGVDQMERRG